MSPVRHSISRALSWVRCETCLRRRFVVVGPGWPKCCGHRMEAIVIAQGVTVNEIVDEKLNYRVTSFKGGN